MVKLLKFPSKLNKVITFVIKALLSKKLTILDKYAFQSFSQMGEDMILRKIFEEKENGLYVDVGAYHPKQYSNTYYFYLKGWRGINIDPSTQSMSEFKTTRNEDINLEIAISDKKTTKTFYIFNETALNGFIKKLSYERDRVGKYRIIKKQRIRMFRLDTILDEYLPKGKEIDFMNIDVEGMDYNVLNSNNWRKYKPKIIVIEDLTFSINNLFKSRIYRFLVEKGYSLVAKTDVSLLFKRV